MKVPTHIFMFKKELDKFEFDKLKIKTFNQDFDVLQSPLHDYFVNIFSLDQNVSVNWSPFLYAIFDERDFVTLSLMKLNTIIVYKCNQKLIHFLEEGNRLAGLLERAWELNAKFIESIDNFLDADKKITGYKPDTHEYEFDENINKLANEMQSFMMYIEAELDEYAI